MTALAERMTPPSLRGCDCVVMGVVAVQSMRLGLSCYSGMDVLRACVRSASARLRPDENRRLGS